ncbi:hypothetical protein MN210_03265 [Psychrobacter raelei]|uniref:Uncharacterized protein n=1 Tax=Psychrobacter raelei TaxID=2565531 RepID=A0AAT9PG57_9GAMM|nr:hypothetical protein [Psychrobacter sp. PraFG1]UNK05818.1 hypothetical protein MN210_03265 [Psychrobacter sp. PraFG1]
MENKTVPLSDVRLTGVPLGRETIRPAKPQKTIQDWLLEDNQRNEFKRDVEQMKRDVDAAIFMLRISGGLLSLVFIMQMLLWFAG